MCHAADHDADLGVGGDVGGDLGEPGVSAHHGLLAPAPHAGAILGALGAGLARQRGAQAQEQPDNCQA